MSEKIESQLNNFVNNVGNYIKMEYDVDFYWEFVKNKGFFDFTASYGMSKMNVPNTARYVVELILMKKQGLV